MKGENPTPSLDPTLEESRLQTTNQRSRRRGGGTGLGRATRELGRTCVRVAAWGLQRG
ncbi:hypothetical protein ES288_A07G202300v1 [Gossypium darwinii]|uniref:Uncharacterized protein n=2 Tax=Gossypium TaxID=3633 RepID=A0A5D2PUY9_GOSTO|nr:hypothetical protein ES288_A07G202300v1 [Gossypium darwinii]TYI19948.1 hypothetical protein ES332_A07G200100v1 [Gossypium tomentosum]